DPTPTPRTPPAAAARTPARCERLRPGCRPRGRRGSGPEPRTAQCNAPSPDQPPSRHSPTPHRPPPSFKSDPTLTTATHPPRRQERTPRAGKKALGRRRVNGQRLTGQREWVVQPTAEHTRGRPDR